ncbi:MAG: hypothetical protein JXR91_00765 [Deltaproteobacteria bacterium]|nr:hypothetical protein [Deltaproteobacteria bacterium]
MIHFKREFYSAVIFKILPVLTAFLGFSSIAFCGDRTLSILFNSKSFPQIEQLKESLNAQLIDFEISCILENIDDSNNFDESIKEVAEGIVAKSGSFAVLWLSDRDFFLYIKDNSQSIFFTRPLPSSDESIELKYDAVASAVRTLLITENENYVILPKSEKVPEVIFLPEKKEKKIPEDTSDKQSDSKINNVDISARSKDGSEDKTNNGRLLKTAILISYSPYIMSKQNLWVNGVSGGLILKIGSYLNFYLEGGFASTAEKKFRMFRIPVIIKAGPSFDFKGINIGVNLLMTTEINKITMEKAELKNDAGMVYLAMGMELKFGVKVNNHGELFVAPGINIYNAANEYLSQKGEKIFVLNPVQWVFNGGMIFWF